MIKLSKGQVAVLALAATPMAAVGIAGAVATYVNMNSVLHRGASALGLVAAGEGATLIAALVALAVTLMGQHTPTVVRAGMWLVPVAASGVGVALAPTTAEAVVMAFTPLAMTAAGEGVAFVARRVVAYRTGVDIEQQRRSGLLLWHANRAANGRGPGRMLSKAAVWRLTRKFAETDTQLSVQLSEVQRFRIQQGADENLAAVLTGGGQRTRARALEAPQGPASGGVKPVRYLTPLDAAKALERPSEAPDAGGYRSISGASGLGDAECFGELDHLAEQAEQAEQAVTGGLMTADDVAEALNVKPGTVRSYVHRDKLRVAAVVEGRNMFDPADVAKLRP